VLRPGVPPTLARTLHSISPVESLISICREHASNVTRWQDGQMALRWFAADGPGHQPVPAGQRC
jgi:putative transposase